MPRPLLLVLLLAVPGMAALSPPAPLAGQVAAGAMVEFRSQVEEGAEFVRTHRGMEAHESPEGHGRHELTGSFERTASYRMQVAELRADGSGVLLYSMEDYEECGVDPTGRRLSLAQMPGQPSEVRIPLDGSGTGDLSASLPTGTSDDEEAFIAALWISDFVGPVVRADGLPMGFPPALRVGQIFRVGGEGAMGGGMDFTLEGMEELEGRSVARIRIAGGVPHPVEGMAEVEGEISGHVLFDVEAGRLVEWVMFRRTRLTDRQGRTQTIESEDRIVPDALRTR